MSKSSKKNGADESKEWKRAAKGIRYRIHPTRKHGKQPDRYYVIRYTLNGQQKQEALGWLSDGWTLDSVQEELSKLKAGLRTGSGPQSLADKRREANEKARAEEVERQEETKRNILLRDYYEQQYRPWKSLSKPIAFEKEASHWEHWLEPQLGIVPVRAISLEHWYDLVNTLRKANLSQRTIEYICGTLRRIMKHALQHQLISLPPPSAVQIGATAPKDNRRIRVLSAKELTTLLDTLKKYDIHAWRITIFALLVGCRFSDAAKLRWGHVDFERKTISLAKTKTVARSIPVGDELLDMLREFGPQLPYAPVFVSQKGKVYHEAPSALRTVVKHLKLNDGRTKNDRFSFHNLRHMTATDLAHALPLRDLMDYMGWKTPAMALRYMHGNEKIQREAVSKREKKLRTQNYEE